MKIVIVGQKQKKIIEFNDQPIALKLIHGGKASYYSLRHVSAHKILNRKAKELIDALLEQRGADE